MGKVIVTVIEAKDLKAVDGGGTSDPYVKVYHGKKEVLKTKHISKNLNPQWNEQVTINNVAASNLTLNFEVKDYNRIGVNPTIGEYVLDVASVLNVADGVMSNDIWTPPLKGGDNGRLHLKLEFVAGHTEEDHRKSFFGLKK